MNIYVGNLPYKMGDEELRALFAPFGTIQSVQVIIDRRSRRSRGYGFVEMPVAAEAERAINQLNGSDIQGRALRVSESSATGDPPTGRRGKPEPTQTKRVNRGPTERAAPSGSPAGRPQKGRGLLGFIRKLFGAPQ